MKKWIKRLSSICLLLTAVASRGQDIPLGTWRNHFSFQNARLLETGDGKIFCAAENGIFFLDLSDNSINKISKLNGLSDVGAASIAYDEATKTLLIGYSSGLIDLVSSEEVSTIRDIRETNLPGVKTIRDIAVHQKMAYLATSFGIVVVSTESKEIIETFRSIGPGGTEATVFHLEIIDNRIFAIMDNGIQSGDLSANLLDFNNWVRYNTTFEGQLKDFATAGGQIFTIVGDNDIAVLQDNSWSTLNLDSEESFVDLHGLNNVLYVLGQKAVYVLGDNKLELHKDSEHFRNANSFTYNEGFWIADGKNGLITPDGQTTIPNGPLSDDISRLSFAGNNIFALYGPVDELQIDEVDSMGYSYFDNHRWHNETINGFYNITDVEAYHGNLYFSSAGYGLYEQTSESVLDHANSLLKRGWSELGPVITALQKRENLYLLSTDSISSLYVMDDKSNLTSYSANYVGTEVPGDIRISENGILWVRRRGGGIVVLDPDTDQYRSITTGNELPSNVVNDLTIDNSDDVWIATAEGPAVFPDASFPFGGFNAITPIFDNRELLEDENISSIAVDGGNRIWMSTDNGIYVFNNNLTELIDRFTVENSPLPSVQVRQFAYNEVNGEMFMLTDQGMVSLRTGSSAGADTHSEVTIFPNPVRPGYSGLVGIDGLVNDASVKITDINGKLIRHIMSNGGTASWDLLDYNMNRVNTGIYLILSSSSDGEETYIGKIAIIN